MSERLIAWLLKLYPAHWRAEYGPEMEALLRRRGLRPNDVCNVLWSACGERMREPLTRFLLCSSLGGAMAFLMSLVFARSLWRVMAGPVTAVLRRQGVGPGSLIQVTPFEGFAVAWLGLPLVVTTFVTFGLALLLARSFLPRVQQIETRREANRLLLCSAALFIVSSFLSLLAWQHGSLAELLRLCPDPRNAPFTSVGHCFFLFAVSTVGVTFLPQVFVFAFFGWRFRGLPASQSVGGE